jgi:hypothetical protein
VYSVELSEFLDAVVTAEHGWFCLATAKIEDTEDGTEKSWTESFYSWPDEKVKIIEAIKSYGKNTEVYFSPYLFKEPNSKKESALVGKTIVADLDDANVLTIQITPSILVETSDSRHQGYWLLNEELDDETHERLSKKITYAIPRCDRSGWFLGKKVRVPETYNNKYKTGPHYIRVVDFTGKRYSHTDLEQFVNPEDFSFQEKPEITENDLSWAEEALNQSVGPQEMLATVKSSISSVYVRYNVVSSDRSAALWALMTALFRAGMKRDKVFYIAYHSVNNKFKDLKYGSIKALAKDVIRAELAVKTKLPDIKDSIRTARKIGDSAAERSNHIASRAIQYLEQIGTFYHCTDDSTWYIRNDNGRPILLSTRNDALSNMLDNLFGINTSEVEARYVSGRLRAVCSEMPTTAKLANLSSYDHNGKLFVLHTGRRDVLVVTKDSLTHQINGYGGLVFPWIMGNNVISPHYNTEVVWEDVLFGGCLDNLITVPSEEAQAVLKVWVLSVLLRDGLTSRPILALFGAPGSGKSTLFRRVYRFLYGPQRGLNTISNEENFDQAMATDPLVVLDNVDSYASWLPDRLAATVAPTEITKRKLYTDNETVILRRDAMIGITAHNPKFGREDVTDRMLLLTFERLANFESDSDILGRIDKLRNALWGSVLKDIQKVLSTPMPSSGFPQFRVRDFAVYGYWIATALGIAEPFYRGITQIKNDQRSFNLESNSDRCY